MVFHGDYEIEYEIYRKRSDDWRSELLGHVAAISPEEALKRWAENHDLDTPQLQNLDAVVAAEYV